MLKMPWDAMEMMKMQWDAKEMMKMQWDLMEMMKMQWRCNGDAMEMVELLKMMEMGIKIKLKKIKK